MKHLLPILTATLLVLGCTPASINEVLLNTSDISLTWKDQVQVCYDPKTCQLGYNSGRNEFRVYDDRLSDWFTISCSQIPSEQGQTVAADVMWTGRSSTKVFNDLQFSVEKTDETGLIWLWNSSERIGIIIKAL